MAHKKSRTVRIKPAERPSISIFVQSHQGKVLAGILVLYVLLSFLLFDPKPFVGGDNAAYVILSQSLAQSRGLTELWTPEQRPHTQYPPGFPLMLAPISLLKLPYAWYKLVPWLAGLAGILLVWLLLRKQGPTLALATALLLAVNQHYLEFGHWVLSELPFLAMLLLCLWLLSRWKESGKSVWWFLGACLAAAACVQVRSAGIAVVGAVTIHLAAQRRFKWALLFLGISLLLMVPWSLRNAHFGTSGGYLDQFLMRDPYQPELGRVGMGELASRVIINLKLYLTSVWPQLLFPSAETLGLSRAGVLLLTVISLPILLGAALGLRQGGAESWMVLSYLALSAMWPVVWTDYRFALPVLPLILFFLLQGYGWVLGRLLKGKTALVNIVLLTALGMASFFPVMGKVGPALARQYQYDNGDRLAGYDPQWRSFFLAAAWIRDNTPETSIVVSRKPQLFHLASQRIAYCYPFTTDQDSMAASLIKADYVMVEPISGTLQRFLLPAIQPWMDKRFKIVYAAGDPPTYVLQVIKEDSHGP